MSSLGIIGRLRWWFLGEVSWVVEESYETPFDAVAMPILFGLLSTGAATLGTDLTVPGASIAELAGGLVALTFAGVAVFAFLVHVWATAVYVSQPTEIDSRGVTES